MIHYPVMLTEVLDALVPKDGETYVDGTFGNGGYTEAFLKASSCRVIALDRDPRVAPRADELSKAYSDRFELREMPFSAMESLGVASVDAVVLDIGVSSMQIDQAERGFSFMKAGPLDMRMSADGISAADAVNTLAHSDLIRIFQVYGEERRARRIADFIVRAREEADIMTTDSLADIVESAIGRSGKIHPATRVFQALRIFVNDELGELYKGLCAAEHILKPGGRLIVVTFHSLEDRIVKSFLRRRSEAPASGSRYLPELAATDFSASFNLTKRSTIAPSKTEISENARSRSAKMRFGIRTSAPAFLADDGLLPRVAQISDVRPAA